MFYHSYHGYRVVKISSINYSEIKNRQHMANCAIA